MPIYEYRCTACNRISEEWVRSFDAPDTQTCPHCGADSHRIMSHTSFQLKGGGWYVTEYGGHKSGATESDSGSATSAASPADTPAAPADAPSPAADAAPAAASPAPKTETKTESKATAA